MAKVRPVVSEMDGQASPGRRQGVRVAQGLAAAVEWVLRDDTGNPADVSEYVSPSGSSSGSSASAEPGGTVKLLVIECLSLTAQNRPVELAGEVVDAAAGVVKARLTSACVAKAGVYALEWQVWNAAGDLVHVTQGAMIVDRGLGGTGDGPPTVAEIRLHLRDSGPEDNYLIDMIEYDLAELAGCIERPVRVWNETMEFVPRRYDTTNFPYRSKWLDAVIGYLHLLASENYDRNLQEYQAGGTAMRDKAKGQLYAQKGAAMTAAFGDFVKQRKGQLNMEAAFGGTSEWY